MHGRSPARPALDGAPSSDSPLFAACLCAFLPHLDKHDLKGADVHAVIHVLSIRVDAAPRGAPAGKHACSSTHVRSTRRVFAAAWRGVRCEEQCGAPAGPRVALTCALAARPASLRAAEPPCAPHSSPSVAAPVGLVPPVNALVPQHEGIDVVAGIQDGSAAANLSIPAAPAAHRQRTLEQWQCAKAGAPAAGRGAAGACWGARPWPGHPPDGVVDVGVALEHVPIALQQPQADLQARSRRAGSQPAAGSTERGRRHPDSCAACTGRGHAGGAAWLGRPRPLPPPGQWPPRSSARAGCAASRQTARRPCWRPRSCGGGPGARVTMRFTVDLLPGPGIGKSTPSARQALVAPKHNVGRHLMVAPTSLTSSVIRSVRTRDQCFSRCVENAANDDASRAKRSRKLNVLRCAGTQADAAEHRQALLLQTNMSGRNEAGTHRQP